MISALKLQEGHQNLTRLTTLYLIIPFLAGTITTHCSVNNPAKVTYSKFPCGTLILNFTGAFVDNPAWLSVFIVSPHLGNQKKHLPLNIGGYRSPSLFVTVYSLKRHSKQVGNLLLRLI
jgi:hypothetical protein